MCIVQSLYKFQSTLTISGLTIELKSYLTVFVLYIYLIFNYQFILELKMCWKSVFIIFVYKFGYYWEKKQIYIKYDFYF